MEATGQMAAVALVLLLLGATLWALKRNGFAGVARRKSSGRRLECVERLPLGPQQVLHLGPGHAAQHGRCAQRMPQSVQAEFRRLVGSGAHRARGIVHLLPGDDDP